MFKINYSDEQRSYSANLATIATSKSFRGAFDGGFKENYAGLLGEVAFADIFGLERPTIANIFTNDHGVDFVISDKSIDIKTQPVKYWWRDSYSCNLNYSQVQNTQSRTDVFMFCWIHTVEKALCFPGWIQKYDVVNTLNGIKFFEKGSERPHKYGKPMIVHDDMFEIPGKAMRRFEAPEVFIDDMRRIAC
jgi:hypothetical protein